MVWPLIGAAISAGAGLLGASMNRNASEQASARQMAYERENAERQEALQREFAQSGIQWKVEDARKAGVHPLYALGANTVSYSPQSVGTVHSADTSMGSAVASAGQDISRALTATRTNEDRVGAFNKTVQDLTLSKMGLENQLLATQIAKMRGQIGPPMPALTDKNSLDGQPATVIPSDPKIEGRPHLQVGQDKKWYTDPYVTNAEDAEKRYGEMSDWIAGPYNLWRDMLYNSNKYFFPNGAPDLRGNPRHISEVFDWGGFTRAQAPRR